MLTQGICYANLYEWGLRQFERWSWTIGYVPQLNWNWRAYNRTWFFNGFELFVNWYFSEVDILTPKVFYTSLYAWGTIGSFENEIGIIGYVPQLNWKRRTDSKRCFFSGLELLFNLKFSVVVILVPKVCSIISLYALGVRQFRRWNLYNWICSTIKLKLKSL